MLQDIGFYYKENGDHHGAAAIYYRMIEWVMQYHFATKVSILYSTSFCVPGVDLASEAVAAALQQLPHARVPRTTLVLIALMFSVVT